MSPALSKPYDRQTFTDFINDLLPSFSRDIRQVAAISPNFISISSLGTSPELDLQLFEVKVSGSLDKRVSLAADAFRLMKNTASYRTLVAFHSEDTDQWRLSFMTAQPTIKEGKVVTKLTNPRRFSYLLGPGSKLATPTKQLVSKGKVADYEDLSKRFAAEVVNNEFYKEIAKLYDELVGVDKNPGLLKYPSPGEQSHEFAVRLIGRIIFCWFLREKRSANGTPLVPEKVLSRDAASQDNYYHGALAPLFFEVLNKHIRSRESKFQEEPYSTIPYLNGGLFNPDADDHYKFDKALQLSVPGLVDVSDVWLRKLFDLLELYNFTVDENTSYDIDLSIDPEMLGRIFENLLARINPETGETVRKMTGSFYTPREVVEYMVDESLKEYLKHTTKISGAKLDALATFDLSDDKEEPLSQEEKTLITEALNKIKVLDPACGSGAFPIGILQKTVFMLQRTDPDARLWFEKQLSGATPELRHHLEREYKNKNFDYLRKLGVIRESIYGIDIQSIATEISRLRCFLTLVVDQSVDDSEQNRGIEPLPNLDFKFVTANSLIPLELSKPKSSREQTGLFEDQSGITELKELRDDYFTSHNSEREIIKSRFLQAQNQMLQRMISGRHQGFAEVTQRLSSWDPFSHKSTSWFDAEWMFGITEGFDVVIANPPYVDSEHMVRESPELRQKYAMHYKTAAGNWDLYIPFIEQGFRLLKNGGVLTYITPNKWLAVSYGNALREYVDGHLQSIVDLAKVNVFDAGNNPTIFQLVKRDSSIVNVHRMTENYIAVEPTKVRRTIMESDNFGILFSKHIDLIQKVSKSELKVSDLFSVENPFSVSEAYELKPLIRDGNKENESFKFCNTGTIKPFRCAWGEKKTKYLKSDYLYPVVLKKEFETKFPRRNYQATAPKIIFKGMRYFHSFYDSRGEYIAGKSTAIAIPKKNDDRIYACLGILNSKLIFWLLREMYGTQGIDGGINFTRPMIERIPLPLDNAENITNIVKKLTNTSQGKDNALLFDELNSAVYKLYGLSEDEVRVIERDIDGRHEA